MFVRVKKIGAYEYLYLVENAREGGRHVQRVVKALGRRDEVEASGVLDALVASAARHSRRSIVLSSFYRGELAELRRVSIGPYLVFGRLWRETGCGEVINGLLAGLRFGFDVERAIYLTVLHRLMVSGSDRHASRWHHGFRIPGTEDLTLDHAYRAMAWLGEDIEEGRATTDAIEEALYRHRQELFGDVSIAFFDTTSLYFEGAGGETLGQLGHSKDYRPHLKQVVLGMVLDGTDRPFASLPTRTSLASSSVSRRPRRGMTSDTPGAGSFRTTSCTSLDERSRTPRIYSRPRSSRRAMVCALIMPRSATTQTRPIANCWRRRSITGMSVVTSAVSPGHISEHIGRPSWSIMTPTTICF